MGKGERVEKGRKGEKRGRKGKKKRGEERGEKVKKKAKKVGKPGEKQRKKVFGPPTAFPLIGPQCTVGVLARTHWRAH